MSQDLLTETQTLKINEQTDDDYACKNTTVKNEAKEHFDEGPLSKSEEELCYSPIESIEELLNYGEDDPLSPPKCTLLRKTVPLAKNFCDVKIQVNGRRFLRNSCPKTLVCHDFKGGYLDDRFVHGTKNPVNYVFRHWLQTDIFCYFSHKFVTVPPLGWINAAHSHGVQIIGTIITESEEGELLCQKLLRDRSTMEKVVEKLCLIAKHYHFDGYLVNIENKLSQPQEMIEFLRLLTTSMKAVVADSVVLWYDSVTVEGKLHWQNELNNTNKAFFDVCDGIYLNYCWKDEKLQRSVEEAEDREFDVYVGIDVFGRGCYGGGGLETCKAVEKVAGQRLSLAIFAPGWSFECHSYDKFPATDDQLWNKCANYFYFRTLLENPERSQNNKKTTLSSSSYSYQVLMSTDFNQGFGEGYYTFGLKEALAENEENGPWFNLSAQSYQPVTNCFRPSDGNPFGFQAFFDSTKGFLGGGSLQISSSQPILTSTGSQVEPACPLWIPLNVPLQDFMNRTKEESSKSKCAIIAVIAWKKSMSVDDNDPRSSRNPIKIFVEFMRPNISTRKVIRLSNVNEHIAFDIPQMPITIHLKDFLPQQFFKAEKYDYGELEHLTFSIKDLPYDEQTLNGWTLSCFVMDISMCLDWNVTAFRLGAQETVSVGLVSLGVLGYS